jgi:hypothetical protein
MTTHALMCHAVCTTAASASLAVTNFNSYNDTIIVQPRLLQFVPCSAAELYTSVATFKVAATAPGADVRGVRIDGPLDCARDEASYDAGSNSINVTCRNLGRFHPFGPRTGRGPAVLFFSLPSAAPGAPRAPASIRGGRFACLAAAAPLVQPVRVPNLAYAMSPHLRGAGGAPAPAAMAALDIRVPWLTTWANPPTRVPYGAVSAAERLIVASTAPAEDLSTSFGDDCAVVDSVPNAYIDTYTTTFECSLRPSFNLTQITIFADFGGATLASAYGNRGTGFYLSGAKGLRGCRRLCAAAAQKRLAGACQLTGGVDPVQMHRLLSSNPRVAPSSWTPRSVR